jgi:hypothetical protein
VVRSPAAERVVRCVEFREVPRAAEPVREDEVLRELRADEEDARVERARGCGRSRDERSLRS